MYRLSKRLNFMPKQDVVPDPLYPAQYIALSYTLEQILNTSTKAQWELVLTIETPIPDAWFYYELRGATSDYVDGVTAPVSAEAYTTVDGTVAIPIVIYRDVVNGDIGDETWSLEIYRGWDISNKILLYTFGEDNLNPVGFVYLRYTIDNPDAPLSSTDYFGNSVDIDGDYAIIGASSNDPVGGAVNAGSAYIYNAATGSLLHTLDNPLAGSTNQNFGFSVGISGNYAIVGAYQNDPGGVNNAGSAYVYDVTTGALLHSINNPNPVAKDFFGLRVSIDGDYAIIGSPATENTGPGPGTAYIYNVITGNLVHTLNNPQGPSSDQNFGHRVSIGGNYAIVGMTNFIPGNSSPTPGVAYIFDITTGNLLHTLTNPSPIDGEDFGGSVSIDGTHAIVGCALDSTGADRAGSVYIYDVLSGNLLHTINNPAPAAIDIFGSDVSIFGNRAVIGAYFNDTGAVNAGSVYIYDVATGEIEHTVDNPAPAENDRFGYSVAISGTDVIISAVWNNPVGNERSGSAYVYYTDNVIRSVLISK